MHLTAEGNVMDAEPRSVGQVMGKLAHMQAVHKGMPPQPAHETIGP